MKITEAIEAYLKSSFEREETSGDKKFYVSDMGKCLRMRYLKRKGISTEFEPYVYWILQLGNLMHDYGYKALESQGILLAAEETVETEHFKGRYDGKVKNGDKPAPFDFKSTGSYKMKKIMEGEDDEENIAQLLTYTMLLQERGDDVGNSAFAVYLNKETSARLPIPFFQKEYILTNWRKQQLKDEMNKIINFWLEDKVPPCTCPNWMKDYNSYQPLCTMDEKRIKKVLAMLKSGKKIITTNKIMYVVTGKTENSEGKREVLSL